MAIRRVIVLVAAASALTGWLAACSPTTKHRVLTFFFDGVPDPDAKPQIGYPVVDGAMPGTTSGPAREKPAQYPHPPYRTGDCGGCHDAETGQVYMQPNEGLCLRCHAAFTRDFAFVHGPVAVGDCDFCHHHHASAYKHVLRLSPEETCLRCHAMEDLRGGEYHATIDEAICTTCHDPHGGKTRFFLKSADVE